MPTIRTAVIGVGHLGRYHAEKYAAHPQCELAAVVDIDIDAARAAADRHGARAVADYREILDEVDAVSVVTPAAAHATITRECLRADLDVLVEKPITPSLEEADELVALAAARRRILQVGHLERFNPAVAALKRELDQPQFIECHRIAPFKPRGTDVDVLLDLMIHDIDLALDLAGREVVRVDAVGTPVLSDLIDIANARIQFEGGCIANITASRISMKAERKLRVFGRDAYLSADLQGGNLAVYRRVAGPDDAPQITGGQRQLEGDALRDQIDAFVRSVQTREPPMVDGRQARRTLAATLQVRAALARALADADAQQVADAVH